MRKLLGIGPVFAPARLWLVVACFSAIVAGVLRLGRPGLWIDEIHTARWIGMAWPEFFDALRANLNPPVFFVLERFAVKAAGDSEEGLRLLSLLAGVGAVGMTFWAFRPVLNERAAAATAWFLAISPQFFLYARMARYYALMTLVAMAAHGLFVRLAVQRGKPRSWALYGFATAVMLLTSYVTLCLTLAHGVWAVFARRRAPLRGAQWSGLWKPWLAATVAALAVVSPWIVSVVRFHAGTNASFARGAGPAEWAWLLAFDAHALTASELLYPWEPLGLLGIVCGGWLLFVGALAAVRRGLGRSVLLPAAAALALSWIMVSSLAHGQPFVGLPARTLFLWPFAAVIMGLGALDTAQHRPMRWAATLGLLIAWAGGWANLYRAEHYMNPIYLTPGREVASDLAREAQPGDVVLADEDSGANYYLARLAVGVQVMDPVDDASVQWVLASADTRRIWWVRLSRDGSVRFRPPLPTSEELARWGTLESRRGYLQVDPTYRKVKRVALGLPAYEHRVVVERYRRRAG
jgi:hypothetical protein